MGGRGGRRPRSVPQLEGELPHLYQIGQHADRLLGPALAYVDGTEERRHTVSVFNGPPPGIRTYFNEDLETGSVAGWIPERLSERIVPNEIELFIRSDAQIPRAAAAAAAAGLASHVLATMVAPKPGRVSISTMHLAKSL